MRDLSLGEIESVSGGDTHEHGVPITGPSGQTGIGTRTTGTRGGSDPFVASISRDQMLMSGAGSWGDYFATNYGFGGDPTFSQTSPSPNEDEYNPNEWTPEDLEHARDIMENPDDFEPGDVVWAQEVVDAADLPWILIDELHDFLADQIIPGHALLSWMIDGEL